MVCFYVGQHVFGSLLHTYKSQFSLNFVDVHKQDSGNDCGLFSIAYAVALSLDLQPSGACVFKAECDAITFDQMSKISQKFTSYFCC